MEYCLWWRLAAYTSALSHRLAARWSFHRRTFQWQFVDLHLLTRPIALRRVTRCCLFRSLRLICQYSSSSGLSCSSEENLKLAVTPLRVTHFLSSFFVVLRSHGSVCRLDRTHLRTLLSRLLKAIMSTVVSPCCLAIRWGNLSDSI